MSRSANSTDESVSQGTVRDLPLWLCVCHDAAIAVTITTGARVCVLCVNVYVVMQ